MIRVTALGPRFWCRDRWNVFDAVIVVMSITASPLLYAADRAAFTVQLGRVARIFRLFKVVKRSDGLRTMFTTLYFSLPALFNIGLLVTLLGFIFQIIGVQFYSDTKLGEGLSGDCNFRELTSAVVLLMRVLSGDWWQIMLDVWTIPPTCTRSADEIAADALWVNPIKDAYGGEKEWSDCGGTMSPAYFIAFIMLGQCMMLNLLLAVIMDKFSVAYNLEHAPIKPKHLIAYRDAWMQHDPLCYGFMPLAKIDLFVHGLDPPLVPQPILSDWLKQLSAEWTHPNVVQAGIFGLEEHVDNSGQVVVTGKEEGVPFEDLLEILMVSMLDADKFLTFKYRQMRKMKFI
jgi:voltage-dependent calcium channel L type alpha-1D